MDGSYRQKLGYTHAVSTAHTDRFDLWAWSRMAIGVPGVLLGWSPLLQNKLRQQANDGLVACRAKK